MEFVKAWKEHLDQCYSIPTFDGSITRERDKYILNLERIVLERSRKLHMLPDGEGYKEYIEEQLAEIQQALSHSQTLRV